MGRVIYVSDLDLDKTLKLLHANNIPFDYINSQDAFVDDEIEFLLENEHGIYNHTIIEDIKQKCRQYDIILSTDDVMYMVEEVLDTYELTIEI